MTGGSCLRNGHKMVNYCNLSKNNNSHYLYYHYYYSIKWKKENSGVKFYYLFGFLLTLVFLYREKVVQFLSEVS